MPDPTFTGKLLAPETYWNPATYSREMTALADRCWNFAGLVSDMPRKNDFLTVTVGDQSVIVQNFGSEIRAFDNVCSHRYARIRSADRGNGAMRCPYHSWTYDGEGVPLVIPGNEEVFGLDQAECANLALHRWRLELCGAFIFIHRLPEGLSLRGDLGEMFDELAAISENLGQAVDELVCEYNANWKICVENTLDEYHAKFLHKSTFAPLLGDALSYSYFGRHSKVDITAADAYLQRWARTERLMTDRAIKTDTYFHYVVFPMLTIASTFGVSFSLQTFKPLGPEKTQLTSRLYAAKGAPGGAVGRALNEAGKSFNDTVFGEDQFICEQVQLGLRQASGRGVAGRYEQRLVQFQKNVVDLLG